jgi:hypothetical protein
MDSNSTAADAQARSTKRARLNPSVGDVDRISGLDDDVLLRVLGLVLSRQCLGRWTRVPALRFASRAPGRRWPRQPAAPNSLPPWSGMSPSSTASSPGCAIETLSISTTYTAPKLEQLMSAHSDLTHVA